MIFPFTSDHRASFAAVNDSGLIVSTLASPFTVIVISAGFGDSGVGFLGLGCSPDSPGLLVFFCFDTANTVVLLVNTVESVISCPAELPAFHAESWNPSLKVIDLLTFSFTAVHFVPFATGNVLSSLTITLVSPFTVSVIVPELPASSLCLQLTSSVVLAVRAHIVKKKMHILDKKDCFILTPCSGISPLVMVI